jgi:hypothetical protein
MNPRLRELALEAAKHVDLQDWWIVLWGGEWFCGKRSGYTTPLGRLDNLQKLQMPFSLVEGPGGAPRPHVAFVTCPWLLDTLVLPEDALWISCSALKNPDQVRLSIWSTEKLKLEERAARSGLSLATQ